MSDYRAFITDVLGEAAVIAKRNFGKTGGTVKTGDNNQVLTETDIEIGKLLVNRVEKTFPEHNVIDEEAGVIDKSSRYTWVIDPIDGTSNFAAGVPMFGIMIGLLEDDQPVAGGIALPVFDETYVAVKNQGTYCNGSKVNVSSETDLLNALVAYGIDGHQEAPDVTRQEAALLAEIVLGVRNLRTSNSAFDHAMVAKGCYGATLNQTSKIWDNVAVQIVIEEAGGIYTDFWGNPQDYAIALQRADDNFTWCAGPPALHKQLQDIIRAAAT